MPERTHAIDCDMDEDCTCGFYVGRVDCTAASERFETLADAEERLGAIALDDPAGVDRGDYYIDAPERIANERGH